MTDRKSVNFHLNVFHLLFILILLFLVLACNTDKTTSMYIYDQDLVNVFFLKKREKKKKSFILIILTDLN